jgi:uncharacterized protein involved in exopolysaccharide biosynthesis
MHAIVSTALHNVVEAPTTRAAAGPGKSSEVLSYATVWRAVRKHWPIATMCAVLVMLGVAVYTLAQTKIYRAMSFSRPSSRLSSPKEWPLR